MKSTHPITPPFVKTNTFLSAAALVYCGSLLLGLHGMATDKDTLVASEVKFIKAAAAANKAEVTMGGLGVQKAESKTVKTFAEEIVKDHTLAGEELAGLATKKGVEVSAVLEPRDAGRIQELEKYSGAEFDKHFIAEMVSHHKLDVSHFESAARDSHDADLTQWIIKRTPVLNSHLARAQELNAPTVASLPSEPDNTGRNALDRDARTLTPLDQGSSKNDTEITAQIRKAVIAEKSLSLNAHNVKIITVNGKVTLRGPVDSAAEKNLVVQLAGRAVRADRVDCQLEVK